jgi:integrase
MPRKTPRRRIEEGIYRDGAWWVLRATDLDGTEQIERWPGHLDLKAVRTKRYLFLGTLGTRSPRPAAASLTLAVAFEHYLAGTTSKKQESTQRGHMKVFCATETDLADLTLEELATQHHRMLALRRQWLDQGRAPKTVNDYFDTLRRVYRVHYHDPKYVVPCIPPPLEVPETIIVLIDNDHFIAVDVVLQLREQDPRLGFGKARSQRGNWPVGAPQRARTRARYRVLAATGKRHGQIMKINAEDVHLAKRLWMVHHTKRGQGPGVYLNDDMYAAFRLFQEADAWGPFNHGSFSTTLRAAGWPDQVPVYQARHNCWIAAHEAGADLAQIQRYGTNHTNPQTLLRYVSPRSSKAKDLSAKMHRFGAWGEEVPSAAPDTPDDRAERRRQILATWIPPDAHDAVREAWRRFDLVTGAAMQGGSMGEHQSKTGDTWGPRLVSAVPSVGPLR